VDLDLLIVCHLHAYKMVLLQSQLLPHFFSLKRIPVLWVGEAVGIRIWCVRLLRCDISWKRVLVICGCVLKNYGSKPGFFRSLVFVFTEVFLVLTNVYMLFFFLFCFGFRSEAVQCWERITILGAFGWTGVSGFGKRFWNRVKLEDLRRDTISGSQTIWVLLRVHEPFGNI